MTKLSLAAGALTVAVSFAAAAQPALAQATVQAPIDVQAGSYKIEPYHTQVGFSLSHFGFTNFAGAFSGVSGTLQLDPAKPAKSKLDVSIPVETVLTPVPKLNEELKGAEWFDATQFPTATFTSTKITQTGKASATIFGNFTLHGVTRPITLKAHFIGAGINPIDKAYTVGFEATGAIHRADYGVKTYVPLVGDSVTLTIAGAFERQE
jgi:polyisoprenoid-binding protein YceI